METTTPPVSPHRLREWLATPPGPPQGLPAPDLERALSNALDNIAWDQWRQRQGWKPLYREAALDPKAVAEAVCAQASVQWLLVTR
jgi:hypothetical protein